MALPVLQVGALLAEDSSLLRHFFKSDAKRVPLWFGHFRCDACRPALPPLLLGRLGALAELLRLPARAPQPPALPRLCSALPAQLPRSLPCPAWRAWPTCAAAWRACDASSWVLQRWRSTH